MNLFRKHAPGVFSREGGVDMTQSSQLLRHRRSVMDQISAAAVAYNQDFTHKTILVGDSGVGKTSLLVQFDQGKFIPGSFSATVGIGFTNKVLAVDDLKVRLQIWDTAGQERFRSVTHAYYRDAQALLLLYDITSKSSFDNTRAWLTEIHEYAQNDVVIMLLGNKEYGVIFLETSAKTGLNVDEAFMTVGKELVRRSVQLPVEHRFHLHDVMPPEKEPSVCCSFR
uniref:Uncharacterized protein n=2 Tax=Cyprinus carpio TaxID=7962 RepID=A0A8C1ZXG5_CYPCA